MSKKTNAALDRRAALRFGAVGAVATTATVVAASSADAAAGQAVLQGRANYPGATDTSIIAPTAGIAFTVKNTGAGAAGYFFAAKGNGFAGGTSAPGKFGLSTANTATVAGTGAAMGAVGVNNSGVLANTKNMDRFAVEAVNLSTVGINGEGGGLYAEGGEAPGVIAISNIGIPAVVSVGDNFLVEGHEVVLMPNSLAFGATSAVGPEVSFSGTVTLDGAGSGTFDLTGMGVDDVDLSMATPLVSANTGPMPNLWVTVVGTLVQIQGGAPGGKASFRVVGYRTDWGGAPLAGKSARRTATGADVAKTAAKAAKERANRG
jgi:hypothetical protein